MKLSEMWKHMTNFYKMIHRDHPSALFLVMIGGIAKATGPFITLLYSSKILDSLLASDISLAGTQILILLLSTFVLGCIDRLCFQFTWVIADTGYYSVWKQTAHKAYVVEYEEFEKTETLDKIRRAKSGSQGSGGADMQIRESYDFVSHIVSVIYSLIFTGQLLINNFHTTNFILYTFILAFLLLGLMKLVLTIQKKNAQLETDKNHKNEHGNALFGYLIYSTIDVQNGKDIRLYKMAELIHSWYQHLVKTGNHNFSYYANHSGIYDGVIALFTQIFAGCVYIYVGISVLAGAISIGNILLYTGSITRMANELNQAIGLYNTLAYRFEYLGNLETFISSKNMHYDGTLPIEKRDDYNYEFEFKNVSFKYPDTDHYVLKHVNKRLAIVGQNGAGKTTLIKLLCRLYEPTEGEILLNGINIEKYDYAEYTSIFSIVFQDFKLFPLPLDENIACGSRIDEDKCLEVLESVGLKETVMSWPDKQRTRLYKDLGDGINVSGGEAQKIAIARALYKDAPFVIMDEPTAALDPIAEAEIYESFNNLIHEKTAIFISHRMSSCKFCDEIIVFENGEITQKGNHNNLLMQDGLYQQLWNAQAQYYA